LQRFGVGRNANAAAALVYPLFGGGKIAQGFANARARFRNQHMRAARLFARGKDAGGGGGIVALAGAALGGIAGQLL
jgi:hypothetical protein